MARNGVTRFDVAPVKSAGHTFYGVIACDMLGNEDYVLGMESDQRADARDSARNLANAFGVPFGESLVTRVLA